MKIDIEKVVVSKIDRNDKTSIIEIAGWFDSWYEWPKPKWTKEKIIKRLYDYSKSKNGAVMYVAKFDGKVVGTVGNLKHDDTKKSSKLTPWIANAFVKEEYRLNGIYNKLLNRLFSDSKDMGTKKLYLWTDWNELYEKMGFEYLGNINIDDGSLQKLYVYNL